MYPEEEEAAIRAKLSDVRRMRMRMGGGNEGEFSARTVANAAATVRTKGKGWILADILTSCNREARRWVGKQSEFGSSWGSGRTSRQADRLLPWALFFQRMCGKIYARGKINSNALGVEDNSPLSLL